jgi:nitroreductase
MDAIKALKTRRSVRKFKQDSIDKKALEDIIDCGRLAATARNEQPWEFVVVTQPDLRRRLSELTERNGRFIADAQACVAVFCKNTTYFIEDGSAATQNMLVAAHAYGFGACWIAGDKKPYTDKVRDLLGVPAAFKLIALVAIGKAAETPEPPKRKLQDVLHWERY